MKKSYLLFGTTLGISLVLMFLLSYDQIAAWDHFYLALSNFYMSLVMVGAMGLVMLAVMRGMFNKRALTIGVAVALLVVGIGGYVMGRQMTLVGDEAFLKSMIPHHSRAILVCQEAQITNPQIKELCDGIIKVQRQEIREMQRILQEDY